MSTENTTATTTPVQAKSVYERWNEGEYFGFGSFTQSLMETYRKADSTNSKRLQQAFPEYFCAPNTYRVHYCYGGTYKGENKLQQFITATSQDEALATFKEKFNYEQIYSITQVY